MDLEIVIIVITVVLAILVVYRLFKFPTKDPEIVVCRFCGSVELSGTWHGCSAMGLRGFESQKVSLENTAYFVSLEEVAKKTDNWCRSSENLDTIRAENQSNVMPKKES